MGVLFAPIRTGSTGSQRMPLILIASQFLSDISEILRNVGVFFALSSYWREQFRRKSLAMQALPIASKNFRLD
jgi:hypothetical protein